MERSKQAGLVEVLKGVVDTARSEEMKDTYRMLGYGLYAMSRWTLALVLHPIATFQATMQIGDQETIDKHSKRALSLQKLPF